MRREQPVITESAHAAIYTQPPRRDGRRIVLIVLFVLFLLITAAFLLID